MHHQVNFADTAIGNVTALLKSKGMWENTLVVFTADNGGPIYNNGKFVRVTRSNISTDMLLPNANADVNTKGKERTPM